MKIANLLKLTAVTALTTILFACGGGGGGGGGGSGTPATVPDAPTIGTATAGNDQVTVTFSAPANSGGSAIKGYTVTSSPAGGVDSNAGSTALSHVITGLTNGIPYTFSVTATNDVGTSTASNASNSITLGAVLKGLAQAGIFSSGEAVFKGYSGVNKTEFKLKTEPSPVMIDSSGKFSANIGSYAGVLKLEVSGKYVDEATGKEVTVLPTAPLKAAIPSTSVTNNVSVAVTPLTDIAVNKATEGGASLTDASVASSNKAVSSLFGIEDIVMTVPTASDAASLTASTDNKQKAYTAALVTISQYVFEYAKSTTNSGSTANVSSANLQTALSAALTQISSGIKIDNTSATQVVTISAPAVAINLNQATANAATNPITMTLVSAAGSTANSAITTAITNTISASDSSVKNVRTFKLKITGAYTGKIAGVEVGINLPTGVTINSGVDRITHSSAVAATGTGFDTTVLGQVSVDGKKLNLRILNVNGFGIGTFATIYCTAPSTVSAADFSLVAGSKIVAPITGAVIPDLTIVVVE